MVLAGVAAAPHREHRSLFYESRSGRSHAESTAPESP
jgi:hypothetical protein